MESTLRHCPIGQVTMVLAVSGGDLTAKIVEMGIYPGKRIRVLFRAPLGDPLAVEVEGNMLCLRKEEADLIQVGKG